MKYLIVSGGEVKEGFLTWIVKNGGFDVILAADAGMEALYRDHILPDIIVGDFDSVNPDTLEYFHDKEQIEVCMLNPEKDDTDTEYAIREAIRRGAMEIVVIGATGTRIDHVLGNISLLGIGLEEQIKISLVDEHNRIRMINQPLTIRKAACLLFGALIGGITVGVMAAKHKTVRRQPAANSYVVQDSLHLTQQSDLFLYANTTRTARPKDNDRSGSDAHSGSGGSSFGGGGGKF